MLDVANRIRTATAILPPVELTPARRYSWRELKGLSKVQRAFVIADAVRGVAELDPLTTRQMAKLAGVSATYIRYALGADIATRRAAVRGETSLAPKADLVDAWFAATPIEKSAFAKVLGEDVIDAV
jgi:hypothetical protein